mmetsp:Transcript_85561/g.215651  ORF Transcript_85561/g.215651 Transcript_85561/m.215651 type:complete len:134 (-) Transcript_85561:70-471(-)
MSSQQVWLTVASVASAIALLYYLLREDDDEKGNRRKGFSSGGGRERQQPSRAERLETDDLDEEERKALAEVAKKGYYHGRPKSQVDNGPVSVSGSTAAAAAADVQPRRRAEFDDFQKKWDRFDNEKFVRELEK